MKVVDKVEFKWDKQNIDNINKQVKIAGSIESWLEGLGEDYARNVDSVLDLKQYIMYMANAMRYYDVDGQWKLVDSFINNINIKIDESTQK